MANFDMILVLFAVVGVISALLVAAGAAMLYYGSRRKSRALQIGGAAVLAVGLLVSLAATAMVFG
jgi:tetrahydromethanopterin S-methyltransferase subunit D